MQYEDIVYNAGILAMAVRLEDFLEKWERESEEGRKSVRKAKKLPNYSDDKKTRLRRFFGARGKDAKKGMQQGMNALFWWRDAIVHKRANIGEASFDKIRRGCVKVDDWLANMNPPLKTRLPRMGEVMTSCSLRYDMGNAGDLVKHGVLAEFAEWWPGGELRYADPFGGRPWGWPKPTVRNRFGRLKDSGCALWRAQKGAQCAASGGLYYGSSHVVLNAAPRRAAVFADDADKLARADLKISGLDIISEKFPSSKKFPGYDSGDGYSILNRKYAGEFDLILIDPYADFLRDELALREKVRGYGSMEDGNFHKIEEAVNRNDNLWIGVFVLMEDGRSIRLYEKLREEHFAERFLALRCPPIPKGKCAAAGESRYHMEILLVSSRLADSTPRIGKLRERIAKFKAAAEKALGMGEEKIQPWGLDGGRT